MYIASLIDTRSLWPGNGNPVPGLFYVRERTERMGAEGDDGRGCRRVFVSTFLQTPEVPGPAAAQSVPGLFSAAADPVGHDEPGGADNFCYLLTIPAISFKSSA